MKIVLIVPSFPKLSESFIVNKFVGLLNLGHDVHIECQRSDSSEWSRFPQLSNPTIQSRVHVSWPVRPLFLVTLFLPLAFLKCLIRSPHLLFRYLRQGWSKFGLGLIKRFYLDSDLILLSPDLIHIEFGSLAPDRMDLGNLLACKVVVSFRGYDINYVGLQDPDYYLNVWKEADAIHLLGQDLWDRAQRRGCPSAKPHILIPPAVDVEYFYSPSREHLLEIGTRERPLHILSVGRLEWKKGYEYALRAVSLLKEAGIHFRYHIVGDGNYLEPIAFIRNYFRINKVVKLLGAQPREHVKVQLEWADVFLHAAVSEGFCNAVIEAQSMSLPVVCTNADGLSENIVDGQTGFVVPSRDPAAIAEKLATLAYHPSIRKRMGDAGRQRVILKFRLQDQIEAFDRFYKGVLSSPSFNEGLVQRKVTEFLEVQDR